MTQIHFPTLAHPDFAGKTGAGDIGDAMAERRLQRRPRARRDRSAGHRAQHDRVLVHGQRRRAAAAVARIVGPVERLLQHGDGRRHPHAVHHPLARPHSRRPRVATRSSTRSIIFPTLAAAVGADIVPKDRAIDGVNQLPFLEGKQAKSNRDSVIFYAEHAAARREVARLEVPLRVPARAGRAAGAAADAAVQPAVGSAARNRTSRTPIRGRRA